MWTNDDKTWNSVSEFLNFQPVLYLPACLFWLTSSNWENPYNITTAVYIRVVENTKCLTLGLLYDSDRWSWKKHTYFCLTFENKKFVAITKQCFALLPKLNFPANNLNFHWRWGWWDRIQAIFLNLFYFNWRNFESVCVIFY